MASFRSLGRLSLCLPLQSRSVTSRQERGSLLPDGVLPVVACCCSSALVGTPESGLGGGLSVPASKAGKGTGGDDLGGAVSSSSIWGIDAYRESAMALTRKT